jgi:hypothetical protein
MALGKIAAPLITSMHLTTVRAFEVKRELIKRSGKRDKEFARTVS